MSERMLRRKIGQFYLIEHIGSGGMSEVYLALNPKTRERRAVKVLNRRATAPASAYARFLREVEIISGLSHPRIVKIFESGTLEDCYFYAMEFMPRGNLARRIGRGRLPLPEALSLFCGVCDGVAYAHERGVVHRDLKPANVLIDDTGNPAVADFGIAKSLADEGTALTRSNEVMGTIAYLAPEQRCSTKRVDRRADVYSLGAVFYEMLMGFPPLGNFPWPHETRADLPPGLQPLLAKCLAFEPRDRFPDASSLLSHAAQLDGAAYKQDSRGADVAAASSWVPDSDRVQRWLELLRGGTTRERLAVVREMVDEMGPGEANALMKLYQGEEDKVRWGLIRAFGELKLSAAVRLILTDLKSPYHRECAVEALGRIGAAEAFEPILEFVSRNPDAAIMGLPALASTGRSRAVRHLVPYLSNSAAVLRLAAAKALGSVPSDESAAALRTQLARERDEKVRATLAQAVHGLENTHVADQNTVVLEKAPAHR